MEVFKYFGYRDDVVIILKIACKGTLRMVQENKDLIDSLKPNAEVLRLQKIDFGGFRKYHNIFTQAIFKHRLSFTIEEPEDIIFLSKYWKESYQVYEVTFTNHFTLQDLAMSASIFRPENIRIFHQQELKDGCFIEIREPFLVKQLHVSLALLP